MFNVQQMQIYTGRPVDKWPQEKLIFDYLRIEDWGDLNKSGTGQNFDGELRSKSHNLGRF